MRVSFAFPHKILLIATEVLVAYGSTCWHRKGVLDLLLYFIRRSRYEWYLFKILEREFLRLLHCVNRQVEYFSFKGTLIKIANLFPVPLQPHS